MSLCKSAGVISAYVFGILFVSNIVMAQDLNFQAYRKFLMSGEKSNTKLAVQTTCTTSEGQTYRIGETGYDTCLNTLRATRLQKEAAGSKSETLTAPAATVGTTIHIGG